jgi:hypothetical protein
MLEGRYVRERGKRGWGRRKRERERERERERRRMRFPTLKFYKVTSFFRVFPSITKGNNLLPSREDK